MPRPGSLVVACLASLVACESSVWVEPVEPPPWADASSESEASEASSAAESTETSGDGDGDDGTRTPPTDTYPAFVSFRCEETGGNLGAYGGFAFHDDAGVLIESGQLSAAGTAECEACPARFDLSVSFGDWYFGAPPSILTFTSLDADRLYEIELCASMWVDPTETAYGLAEATIVSESAPADHDFHIVAGSAWPESSSAGQVHTFNVSAPSALTHDGRVVAAAVAHPPDSLPDTGSQVAFTHAAHSPTEVTQLSLDTWGNPSTSKGSFEVRAYERPVVLFRAHYHQGFRGVPLPLTGEATGWMPLDVGEARAFEYYLLPNSAATESYLELELQDVQSESQLELVRGYDSSVAASTYADIQVPFLTTVEYPTPEEPRFAFDWELGGIAENPVVFMSTCDEFNFCWYLVHTDLSRHEVWLPNAGEFADFGVEFSSPLYQGAAVEGRTYAGWSSQVDTLIRIANFSRLGFVQPPKDGNWNRWRVTAPI